MKCETPGFDILTVHTRIDSSIALRNPVIIHRWNDLNRELIFNGVHPSPVLRLILTTLFEIPDALPPAWNLIPGLGYLWQ